MEFIEPSDGCNECNVIYPNADAQIEHELQHRQARQGRGSLSPPGPSASIVSHKIRLGGYPFSYDGANEPFKRDASQADTAAGFSRQRTSTWAESHPASLSRQPSLSGPRAPITDRAAHGNPAVNHPGGEIEIRGTPNLFPTAPVLSTLKPTAAHSTTTSPLAPPSYYSGPDSPAPSAAARPTEHITEEARKMAVTNSPQAMRQIENSPGAIAAIQAYQDHEGLQRFNAYVRKCKATQPPSGRRTFSHCSVNQAQKAGLIGPHVYGRFSSTGKDISSNPMINHENTKSSVAKTATKNPGIEGTTTSELATKTSGANHPSFALASPQARPEKALEQSKPPAQIPSAKKSSTNIEVPSAWFDAWASTSKDPVEQEMSAEKLTTKDHPSTEAHVTPIRETGRSTIKRVDPPTHAKQLAADRARYHELTSSELAAAHDLISQEIALMDAEKREKEQEEAVQRESEKVQQERENRELKLRKVQILKDQERKKQSQEEKRISNQQEKLRADQDREKREQEWKLREMQLRANEAKKLRAENTHARQEIEKLIHTKPPHVQTALLPLVPTPTIEELRSQKSRENQYKLELWDQHEKKSQQELENQEKERQRLSNGVKPTFAMGEGQQTDQGHGKREREWRPIPSIDELRFKKPFGGQTNHMNGNQDVKSNQEDLEKQEWERQKRDRMTRERLVQERQQLKMEREKQEREENQRMKKPALPRRGSHTKSVVDSEENDENRHRLDSVWKPLTFHSKQGSSSRPAEQAGHDPSTFQEVLEEDSLI
ncbi:MAG: hypothetical protein M1831_007525 [Alyxoria varia]|nr:MAG: hypothetical protein M1831_007525 [Alyxoria varia]